MFVKLDCGILDSSLWAQPADHAKLWITLLAMADREGLVKASLPAIARRAYMGLPTATRIMRVLMEADPHSRSMAEEGRRVVQADGGYRLVTFVAYREKGRGEERAEKNLGYVRDHRARKAAAKASVSTGKQVSSQEERRSDQTRGEENGLRPPATDAVPVTATDALTDELSERRSLVAEMSRLLAAIRAAGGRDGQAELIKASRFPGNSGMVRPDTAPLPWLRVTRDRLIARKLELSEERAETTHAAEPARDIEAEGAENDRRYAQRQAAREQLAQRAR